MKSETKNLREAVYDLGGPKVIEQLMAEFTPLKIRPSNWMPNGSIPRKFIIPVRMFDKKYSTNLEGYVQEPSLQDLGVETPFTKLIGDWTPSFLESVNNAIKNVNATNPTETPRPLWTGAQVYQYMLRGYAPYWSRPLLESVPEYKNKITDDMFEKPSRTQADDLLG